MHVHFHAVSSPCRRSFPREDLCRLCCRVLPCPSFTATNSQHFQSQSQRSSSGFFVHTLTPTACVLMLQSTATCLTWIFRWPNVNTKNSHGSGRDSSSLFPVGYMRNPFFLVSSPLAFSHELTPQPLACCCLWRMNGLAVGALVRTCGTISRASRTRSLWSLQSTKDQKPPEVKLSASDSH